MSISSVSNSGAVQQLLAPVSKPAAAPAPVPAAKAVDSDGDNDGSKGLDITA